MKIDKKKMIRKVLFLLNYFVFNFSFGQYIDLAKLTDGKLIFSSILSNPEKDMSPWGYFFLIEKPASKDKLYEYIILDGSLNKIYTNQFLESNYQNTNIQKSISGHYQNGYLLIQIKENGYSDKRKINNSWNRIINLKQNKISAPFYISIDNQDFNIVEGSQFDNAKENIYFSFEPFLQGYKYQAWEWPYPLCYYENVPEKKLPLWCKENSKKNGNTRSRYTKYDISPIKGNMKIALLRELNVKRKLNDTYQKVLDVKYKLIDIDNGNLYCTLNLPEPKKKDSILQLLNRGEMNFTIQGILKNHFFITENLALSKNNAFKSYSQEYYSANTGKKITTYTFNIKSLSSYLNFDEKYNIIEKNKNNGFLKYIKNYELKNGNNLFIFETTKNITTNKEYSASEFGDFIFTELDKNLNILSVKTFHNKKRVINNKKDRDNLLKELKKQQINVKFSSDYSIKFVNLPLTDLKFIQKTSDDAVIILYHRKNKQQKVYIEAVYYKNGNVIKLTPFPALIDDKNLFFLPAKDGYVTLCKESDDPDILPKLELKQIK